ncbi:hypothetical protein T459_14358 [Capsicum annuum]|uniref:Uncharacterized protein n=1 Tax=Capsicum annuum TaxID=4072 RepID=A0A2G2ZH86_CAPAN|nr:hypothetical protein T459_14358 [Capsicum annuum]
MELLMEYDLVLGQWHLIGKAHGRANESTDYMICLLAHGVVSRVCFGAWPMAFDWERPWKFLPAVCVFGSSWIDWHKIFARTKANEFTYYMICLLAHGVVNGVWFGAWPMEFDWESPWQECYLIAKDSRANESTDYMICLLPHGVVSGVCFGAWPMAFDWESPWKFLAAVCVFGSSWTDWHKIFARTKANESTDYMICLLAHEVVSGVCFGAWPMAFDWESPWKFLAAVCVFGSSWTDWHKIFARTKANDFTDFMICLLAYGVVSGVWFGAWPMTFDWESPWQFLAAVCVFGSSWTDWHKIFARTKANDFTDFMICLLAYGVVSGVWFGAWPMTFDWESPWQISIIHPYRRHTSAGNMFVLFSNVRACLRSCIGGGVPESKRANELGRLLDVNILPLQVIQGHTPFKQLMRRFENEIVVVVGKGGPTEVMSEYGFKYTH